MTPDVPTERSRPVRRDHRGPDRRRPDRTGEVTRPRHRGSPARGWTALSSRCRSLRADSTRSSEGSALPRVGGLIATVPRSSGWPRTAPPSPTARLPRLGQRRPPQRRRHLARRPGGRRRVRRSLPAEGASREGRGAAGGRRGSGFGDRAGPAGGRGRRAGAARRRSRPARRPPRPVARTLRQPRRRARPTRPGTDRRQRDPDGHARARPVPRSGRPPQARCSSVTSSPSPPCRR